MCAVISMGAWPVMPSPVLADTRLPSVLTTSSGPQPALDMPAASPVRAGTGADKAPGPGAPEETDPQEPLPQQKQSILVPDVPDKDNGKIIVTYKSKIEETQTMMRTINESQLTKEQHDTLISVHSFLEKAQEAYSQDDMPMAMNLAEKAHTLTKEIVKNSAKP